MENQRIAATADSPLFHYDEGLKITAIDLAVDVRRRQPRGFISHAHADHMAPHVLTFCTPITGKLYRHRMGSQRAIQELSYGSPATWNDWRLTTFPAGHVLGSAMLLVENGPRSLLYTGDFKLSPSATAEAAAPPPAEILVMESTFGDPKFRMPPRDQVIEELLHLVRQALAQGRTPVIQAYVLGKAQEVTRILLEHGLPVQQHPEMAAISRIYQESGCELGELKIYDGIALPGHVVLEPPVGQKSRRLPIPRDAITIAVTGWAVDPRAKFRLGVDYAVPLTDHADYDELLSCIERVGPKVVYCTHGPREFAEHLCRLGIRAYPLAKARQLRLF